MVEQDLLEGGEPPRLAPHQLEEEVAEQDVESREHAVGTPSHRAQI